MFSVPFSGILPCVILFSCDLSIFFNEYSHHNGIMIIQNTLTASDLMQIGYANDKVFINAHINVIYFTCIQLYSFKNDLSF